MALVRVRLTTIVVAFIATAFVLVLAGCGKVWVEISMHNSCTEGTLTIDWNYLGEPRFSSGTAQYISMALDSSGNPYVAYEDGANSNKATVMHWTGITWAAMGSANFSIDYSSIAINGSTGVPYVAYSDINLNKALVVRSYVP